MEKQSTSSYSCVRTDNRKKSRGYCLTMTRSSVPKHKHSYSYVHSVNVKLLLPSFNDASQYCGGVQSWMGWWLFRLCFSIPLSLRGKHVCLCIKCLVRKAKLYLEIGHFEGAQGGKVADTDTSVCFLCAGFARVHAPVPCLFSQVRNNNRSNYKLSKQSWTTRRVSKNNNSTHVSPAMNFKQISLSSLSSILFVPTSHPQFLPPLPLISFSVTFSPYLLHILSSLSLSLCFSVSQD